ncbi:hypothetical protein NEUTE2DRAFT_58881, partial [Neurospora tetrasperma FGSC 2509]
SLKYNPRFGVLTNIVKYLNRYTINGLTNKIINLGDNSIYIILPSFIADFIE